MLNKSRDEKIKNAIRQRQTDIVVVMENVHDPHNVGAIIRSCESVGILHIFILYSKEGSNTSLRYVGRNAVSGASKWVRISFFDDIDKCFEAVKKITTNIYSTALDVDAKSIYQTDFSTSFALVFGNEKDGLTPEVVKYCTGNLIIPMVGMVQSLNVSVACSIICFEMLRQRTHAGLYDLPFDRNIPFMDELYVEYLVKCRPRVFEADPTGFEDYFHNHDT